MGLYVDIHGKKFEGASACAYFLQLLRDMIRVAGDGMATESTAAAASPSREQ
jgi:hypothetical protein